MKFYWLLLTIGIILSLYAGIVSASDPVADSFNSISSNLSSAGIVNNINTVDMNNVTSFSGLSFEKPGFGKIVFTDALDLSDNSTLTFLSSIGNNLDINSGKISLSALDSVFSGKNATIIFYGLSSSFSAYGINANTSIDTFLNKMVVRDENGTVLDKNTVLDYDSAYFNSSGDRFSINVVHFTSFSLDFIPPSIILIYPEAGKILNPSNFSVQYSVNDSGNVDCSLIVTDGTRTVNTVSIPNVTADGSTNRALLPSGLGDGNRYYWEISCTDSAGNVGQSGQREIDVDTTAPWIDMMSSDELTFFYNAATLSPQTIKIPFSEFMSSPPAVVIDDVAQTLYSCESPNEDATAYCFDYTIPNSTEEETTITVSNATDLAGNVMDLDNISLYIYVDTIVPLVTINPVPLMNINNSYRIDVSGKCNSNDSDVLVLVTGMDAQQVACTDEGSGGEWTVGTLDFTYVSDGEINITAEQIDNMNNIGWAQVLTIKDLSAPVITLNGGDNITVDYNSSYVEQGASVIDNVDNNLAAVIGGDVVNTKTLGSYVVTYNAVDSAGNNAVQINRTVNVRDMIPPVITLNGESVVNIGWGTDYTELGANVTDNYDSNLSVLITGFVNKSVIGSYVVTYNAVDSAGNNAVQINRTVNVRDMIPPVISWVPDNIVREAVNYSGTVITYTLPVAEDDVDGVVPVSCSPASGSIFRLGNNTVNCSSVDSSGNNATDGFNVDIVDTTAPNITARPNEIVEASGPLTSISLELPLVWDAADPSPTITSDSPGEFGLSDTVVTWTARDSSGNNATAHQTITVVDTTAPDLTIPPNEIFLASGPLTNISEDPTNLASAYDLVDGYNVNLTSTFPGLFPVGTTTVNYTAVDSHGNRITKSRTIEIQDNTAPVFYNISNIVREATSSSGASVDYSNPNAVDDVDGAVNVSCSPVSGVIYSLGNTSVYCSAMDSHGNGVNDSFNIDVVDTTAPDLTIPADMVVNATGVRTAVDVGNASAYDYVDGAVPVISDAPADFSLGTSVVNYTATDSRGNRITKQQNIYVIDATSPSIDLVRDITNIEASNSSGNIVSYSYPATHDQVDGEGIASCSPESGSLFAIGNTSVICNAKDSAGNNATPVSFIINVLPLNVQYATNQTETLSSNTSEIIIDSGSSAVSNIIVPAENTGQVNVSLTALQNNLSEVTLSINFTLTKQGTSENYSAQIPANTVINGGTSWDGKLSLPIIMPNDNYSLTGGTPTVVVELGSSIELNFSQPVSILMGGMAGKRAAWTRNSVLVDIPTVCNSINSPGNINSSVRECYIDSRPDLLIWTYHFTTFAAYSPTVTSSPTKVVAKNHGGGGGAVVKNNVSNSTIDNVSNVSNVTDKNKVNEENKTAVQNNDKVVENKKGTITGSATGNSIISKGRTITGDVIGGIGTPIGISVMVLFVFVIVGFIVIRIRRKKEENRMKLWE